MLATLKEYRLYLLAVPVAAILYGSILALAPVIRPVMFGYERARLVEEAQAAQTPVLVKSAPIPPPTVRLSPDSIALTPGQDFSVDLWLDTPETTRGIQFGFSYDPKLIQVTDVSEGEYYRKWAIQNKASTSLIPGVKIDQIRGTITPVGIAIIGGPPGDGPTGNGVVATVKGRALAGVSGATTLKLEGVEVAILKTTQANPTGIINTADSVQAADAQIAVGAGVATPVPPAVRSMLPYRATPVHPVGP
jgi:hypothetical protein